MKRFIAAGMAAMMMFTSTAFAADTTIFVGDKQVEYTDQTPVIINDRTYVPIRDVFEELGFAVEWDAETKTVDISNDYYQIVLFTQTSSMFNTNIDFELNYGKLENPVQIVNGRTLLPLREILETANYSLEWDAETKSTVITDSNNYTELDAKISEFEDLFSGAEAYVYDPEKPSQELTEEEFAFLDNMFDVLAEMQNLEESDLAGLADFDEMTPEAVEALTAIVRSYTTKIQDVKCPDSLKGVDTGIIKMFDNIIDDVVVLTQMEADNPGYIEEAGFGIAMFFVMSIVDDAAEATAPIQKLAEEKNLDLEALFGDKVTNSAAIFG